MAVLIEDEITAVEALQFVAAKGLLGRALATEPAVETQHPVTTATDHLKVMGDLQDRQPLLEAQLLKELVKLLSSLRVKASSGLIKNQQTPGMNRAERQQHSLQLTSGEFTEQAAAQMTHLQPLQHCGYRPAVVAARAAAQPHKLLDGQREATIKQQLLWEVSHLITDGSRQTTAARQGMTKQLDGPTVMGQKAQQRLHQGAFTSTIGAD